MMAPAASAEARWMACAAPTIVAAPWNSSPANCRKNLRRPGSASSPSPPPLPGSAPDASDPGSGGVASAGRGSCGSVNERLGAGRSRAGASGGASVLDDAGDAATFEAVAPLEEVELDEERQADDLALQPLDELDRALDGAARREEVVDDEDLLPGRDGVAVDLERVRAVLEGVLDGDRLGRQLAELADG